MFEIIVGTVIIKNKKILMVKEKKEGVKGLLNFPAGHLEAHETLVEAAKREIKEETGFDAKINSLIDTQYFNVKDKNLVIFIFQGELIETENNSANELDYAFYDIEYINANKHLLRSEEMIISALSEINRGDSAAVKILK